MSLKDFRPDASDLDVDKKASPQLDDDIKTSRYQDEINTLKIEKLSNRITIISVILPCIIGAIIVFAYLDMKERVVDVDETKNTQVERISKLLDEKLNALDIKIAKNNFNIEKKLPDIEGKLTAVEGQLAKLIASKADNDKIQAQFKKVNQGLTDQTRKMTGTLSKNEKLIENNFKKIKKEINMFKEEFDARLLELSQYQEQIGELGKNLSLLDKKIRNFENESITAQTVDSKFSTMKEAFTSQFTELKIQTDKLNGSVDQLNKRLTVNLTRLQNDIDLLMGKTAGSGPKPQINMDHTEKNSIEEAPLTQ